MSGAGNNALEKASNDANQNMSPTPAGSPTQSCGSAPTPDTTVSPDKTHWIAIELVDELGKHVPYEDYRITLPDGTPIEGTLDKKGLARINGIDPGTCKITFPNRDKGTWKSN
jgi:type VI secretion system secreted protein VgrG